MYIFIVILPLHPLKIADLEMFQSLPEDVITSVFKQLSYKEEGCHFK